MNISYRLYSVRYDKELDKIQIELGRGRYIYMINN